MNRWFLDENNTDIYLKCADDVRWHYNKNELVRILNDLESEIENWRTMYDNVVRTCHNDSKEIKRLKEQNLNYESQNKRVLEKLDLIVRSNQDLEKENQLLAKTLRMFKCIEKEVNQDKISFCIDQLEKVKEEAKHYGYEFSKSMHEYIDNQIKQLKENKYD